jgi:hypothetical protein
MKEFPEVPPPLPPEMVPPELPRDCGSRRQTERPSIVRFNPWSAALLLAVDNLWALPDFAVTALAVTVPVCFLMVFSGVFFIQRRQQTGSVSIAPAKALVLAVIAAMPTSITAPPSACAAARG